MKESFGEFNKSEPEPESIEAEAIPEEVLRSLADHRNDIPDSVIESIEKQDLQLGSMFGNLAEAIRTELASESDPTKRAILEDKLRKYEELSRLAKHDN